MGSVADRVFGVIAGLMGAAGVAASAAGAHSYNGSNLDIAGEMLLIHAAALLALSVGGLAANRIRRIGASVLVAGTVFFCGDLVLRAFFQVHAFPMAAPFGGLLMMAGWLIAALSYAGGRRG